MLVIKSSRLCCKNHQNSFRFLATLPSSVSSEWKAIHKFRYINGLSNLAKLKNYQIGATIAAVPATFAMPEIFNPAVVSVIGCSGLATLCLASFVFKNTVGFVYTSQKRPELVKFSFMDFWGRRKDVELKIDDVVPMSELPKGPFDDFFTNLKFRNGHLPGLKLFYKAGGISDHEEFIRVFGSD